MTITIKPYNTDGVAEKKEEILEDIYEGLFPWINEGITKIQNQYGMTNGDCSVGLDMEFREVYSSLVECIYKQLQENNAIEYKESDVE